MGNFGHFGNPELFDTTIEIFKIGSYPRVQEPSNPLKKHGGARQGPVFQLWLIYRLDPFQVLFGIKWHSDIRIR